MKRLLIIVAFAVSTISVHSNAIAQEMVFIPRVEAGAWLFDSKLSVVTFPEDGKQRTWFDLSETMGVLQVGGVLQGEQFYVDAYVQQSTSASGDPNNETLVEDGIDSYADQDADFERSEYSILFGYQLSQFSLFAGYRFQDTDIEETLPINPEIISGERAPDTWDINIDSGGPFLGAKYVMPIGPNSELAMTASIGYFDQEYENAYTMIIGSGALSELKMLFDFETDVLELGLGLAYTQKITPQLEFSMVGQLNYYTFDESIDLTTGGEQGVISVGELDFEADELNLQLRVGLQYRF
jgi:hypothetical protein